MSGATFGAGSSAADIRFRCFRYSSDSMKPSRDQIESAIAESCARYGYDVATAMRQCQAESSFNPDALNARTVCVGLFQLQVKTAKWLGVNPYDWRENIEGGCKYMVRLLEKYHLDRAKALAAYNWGPGNLDALLHMNPNDWREHLPVETKGYLRKILEN